MKSLIIYGSHHHRSTETLVKAITQAYDLIGFASGIDFGKFYPAVTDLAQALPEGKHGYSLFTCARDNGKYGDEIRDLAMERKSVYHGRFGCRGYNTYGPWKPIGGMNKNHPSPEEIADAMQFYEGTVKSVKWQSKL